MIIKGIIITILTFIYNFFMTYLIIMKIKKKANNSNKLHWKIIKHILPISIIILIVFPNAPLMIHFHKQSEINKWSITILTITETIVSMSGIGYWIIKDHISKS